MLTKRAQILLKSLMERHILEGQPVGSQTLAKHAGLDISPATIRNIMGQLEEAGYLLSPHTSAGRIPTAKGYRFFIDSLLTVQPLDAGATQRLESYLFKKGQHCNIALSPQELILSTSQALSELTHFAGVVMLPKKRIATFKQLEFVRLSENRVLLILVMSDGEIQNKILMTGQDYAQDELIRAANFINAHYANQDFHHMMQALQHELSSLQYHITDLLKTAVSISQEIVHQERDDYIVSGESNLLRSEDLTHNMGQLSQLFDLFEQKTKLLALLDAGQKAQGVNIFIGGENELMPIQACSLITTHYHIHHQVVGTLGVIGPMRMNYEKMIPIVDMTAKLLSHALSAGHTCM